MPSLPERLELRARMWDDLGADNALCYEEAALLHEVAEALRDVGKVQGHAYRLAVELQSHDLDEIAITLGVILRGKREP